MSHISSDNKENAIPPANFERKIIKGFHKKSLNTQYFTRTNLLVNSSVVDDFSNDLISYFDEKCPPQYAELEYKSAIPEKVRNCDPVSDYRSPLHLKNTIVNKKESPNPMRCENYGENASSDYLSSVCESFLNTVELLEDKDEWNECPVQMETEQQQKQTTVNYYPEEFEVKYDDVLSLRNSEISSGENLEEAACAAKSFQKPSLKKYIQSKFSKKSQGKIKKQSNNHKSKSFDKLNQGNGDKEARKLKRSFSVLSSLSMSSKVKSSDVEERRSNCEDFEEKEIFF